MSHFLCYKIHSWEKHTVYKCVVRRSMFYRCCNSMIIFNYLINNAHGLPPLIVFPAQCLRSTMCMDYPPCFYFQLSVCGQLCAWITPLVSISSSVSAVNYLPERYLQQLLKVVDVVLTQHKTKVEGQVLYLF